MRTSRPPQPYVHDTGRTATAVSVDRGRLPDAMEPGIQRV